MPKFSKYLHGVTSLYPNRVESIPYWFLPADKEGYMMTPATWEEMADPKDPYLRVIARWLLAWSYQSDCHGGLHCMGKSIWSVLSTRQWVTKWGIAVLQYLNSLSSDNPQADSLTHFSVHVVSCHQ